MTVGEVVSRADSLVGGEVEVRRFFQRPIRGLLLRVDRSWSREFPLLIVAGYGAIPADQVEEIRS